MSLKTEAFPRLPSPWRAFARASTVPALATRSCRPWLESVRAAFPDQKIRIFKIATGEAYFWDMSVNCREKEQSRYTF